MDGGKPIQRQELREILYEVASGDRSAEGTADLIINMINENYTLIEPEEEPQEQTGE